MPDEAELEHPRSCKQFTEGTDLLRVQECECSRYWNIVKACPLKGRVLQFESLQRSLDRGAGALWYFHINIKESLVQSACALLIANELLKLTCHATTDPHPIRRGSTDATYNERITIYEYSRHSISTIVLG